MILECAALAALFASWQVPDPWRDPGFANFVWIQSPNYNRRPEGAATAIDTVVLHSTVTPTLEATTKWFASTESKVSAHFTIGRDGSIVQHVSTFERAWHAGVSRDAIGRENLNHFSVGIELVNLNDGKDPYPFTQVEALKLLLVVLKRRFPELRTLTTHAYVAKPPGRKSDPLNFPWPELDGMGLAIVR